MARTFRQAGAVAVVLSLWLPWYVIRLPASLQSEIDRQAGQLPAGLADFARGLLAAIPRDIQVTGWQAFGGADVAMAFLAGAVMLLSFATADRSLEVLSAAALAVLVLFHVVERPGPAGVASLKEGALLALAGAALVLGGTYMDRDSGPLPAPTGWAPAPPS